MRGRGELSVGWSFSTTRTHQFSSPVRERSNDTQGNDHCAMRYLRTRLLNAGTVCGTVVRSFVATLECKDGQIDGQGSNSTVSF